MSSYCSTKSSTPSSINFGTPPLCNIKGRIIPYREFLPRLKNYCLSLGFHEPIVVVPASSTVDEKMSAGNSEQFFPGKSATSPDNDSVIILSAKIPYEPSWGGFSGLPRPLIHERIDHHAEDTVSNFIAPYLLEYQWAQKHIYLSCNAKDQFFVTLPSELISGDSRNDYKKLKIHLAKIAESDKNGQIFPFHVSESLVSYSLSKHFLQVLSDKDFSWQEGRSQRIGTFLTEDLFDFLKDKEVNNSNGQFVETLLPLMNSIVTNVNPQLRAALIHLQSEFTRTVDDVQSKHRQNDAENLLCVAGLDIDVAAFKGRGKRYFVPWASYWQHGGTLHEDTYQLEQDDLFVALMAQEKQYLA